MSANPYSLPEFAARHIGPRDEDIADMLAVIGKSSLEELTQATLPGRLADGGLGVGAAASEQAMLEELRAIAASNATMTSLIGLGYNGTVTPPVIQRNILENPAWYTAYTPYQPEISQGRLEALLSFQTMVADLVGLDVANASMLDEATAAGEAMTLMRRATKAAKEAVLLIDDQVFPQTAAVCRTRALPLGIEVQTADLSGVDSEEALAELSAGRPVFGVLVQYPGRTGGIGDWRALVEAVHAQGGLVTAAADLLALTTIAAPGDWGADIAVGTTQRFGVPMGFGGPHAGYLAVREKLARTMPGRLVGVSIDADGKPAYRLALQTREQHIRREKATSNICTAQVLLAVMAAMYAVYHGPAGLRRIAQRVHDLTASVAAALTAAGLELANETYFDRLTVTVPGRADEIMAKAVEAGYNLWREGADAVSFSFDEVTDEDDARVIAELFGASLADVAEAPAYPEWAVRSSEFLTAPVFNTYHSETQMMRYLRLLADRDYALDRGMIPLGSCTMKLNAAAEMQAITWPSIANQHPFAPADQTQGSRRIVADLQEWLKAITGYDAVSMQPNSGASGELAALMAMRSYHRANGDEQRDVCLLPASAHGTNAASAAMAGMRVVVVKSADDGTIDMVDLRAKVEQHRDVLAAIMVTYPSTHGVYEDTISDIEKLVHEAGGQVYVDGANMNALVGIAKPGHFGGDASHLNLHKTFAIPHGGGGPGVGPIGVRSHLAPYLPNHPLDPTAGPETSPGPAAAAPFGSMGVMPISWAYIRLMGDAGLTKATRTAVLNANYIAARLNAHFPVLYTGPGGVVAHECILDLRQITKETGVTVDDVAKRLIDYGFHAPTMSFPVAGTLMVEPTESEDKMELDRFIDAMIAIRHEIDEIAQGTVAVGESALRGAPHTAQCLVAEWDAAYGRATAVYPAGVDPLRKYWPPVRRIDGAYGDRHLICSCPTPEEIEAMSENA